MGTAISYTEYNQVAGLIHMHTAYCLFHIHHHANQELHWMIYRPALIGDTVHSINIAWLRDINIIYSGLTSQSCIYPKVTARN